MAVTRGLNPIWWLPDLDGNALDDRYYLFVLNNQIPYQPLVVYKDSSQSNPWPNPIQFLANGTLPDNIYWDSDQTYRLEIRMGNTQNDDLVYRIENYEPGGSGSSPTPDIQTNADNQITNPQFYVVDFPQEFEITTPGDYSIAPGWVLSLSGSGTVTLNQQSLTTDNETPTNASWALRVEAQTWTGDVILKQRFENTNTLWRDTQINAQCTAQLVNGSFNTITSSLVNADGNQTVATLFSGTLVVDAFNRYSINVDVDDYTDTNAPDDQWLELQITLPNSNVDITSVQVSPGAAEAYEQESIERQIDQTFHTYRDYFLIKPVPSFAVGWDFALNPWQFTDPSATTSVTGSYTGGYGLYTADQTVVACENDTEITVTQGSDANKPLVIQEDNSGNTTGQFAVVQYIDKKTAAPLIGQRASILVRAYTENQASANPIDLKARILSFSNDAKSGFPTVPFDNQNWGDEPTFDARFTGVFSPANDFNRVIESGLVNQFSGDLKTQDYAFENFELTTDDISAGDHLAIVIFSRDGLENTNARLNIQSISLTPGEFAAPPLEIPFDETLRACQFYWEQSYPFGITPGTVTSTNSLYRQQTAYYDPNASSKFMGIRQSFDLQYKTAKRTTPTVILYSTNTSTGNRVRYYYRVNGSNSTVVDLNVSNEWNQTSIGTHSVNFVTDDFGSIGATSAPSTSDHFEAFLQFQYTLDARFIDT